MPFRNKHAFTLIEILLVVLILFFLVGLAVPNLARFYAQIQLKKTVDDLVLMMRYAQSRAVTQGHRVRLAFAEDALSFWLEEEDPSGEGPSGGKSAFRPFSNRFARKQKIPPSLTVTDAVPTMDFYPNGNIQKEQWQICGARQCLIISTKPQRGHVHVFQMAQE